MGRLTRAIETWIRAEYFFRQGPDPYTRAGQDSLLKAEDKLRKVITGETDIIEAARALGVHVNKHKRLYKERMRGQDLTRPKKS